MTQPPAYEFEEDDAPKPERKPFIPGLAEAVAAPATPAPAPIAAPGPSAARMPSPPAPPAAVRAPAPAPLGDAGSEDPDLKPGSRKDLWACPHCETKNNPARPTCRQCGKSPSDPVAKKWFQRPAILGAIGVVLVAIVALWVLTRPDLSLKAPGTASLARGSKTTIERDLGGKTFTPRSRLSACGRVLISRAASGVDGVTTVVLLLGKATDDEVAAANPSFNNELVSDLPAKSVVLHLVTGEKLDLTKGAWLSVVGDSGQLFESGTIIRSTDGADVVVVEQLRQ